MQNRKNIIFIVDAISGGVGRVILLLSEAFTNRDCNCHIVTLKHRSENSIYLPDEVDKFKTRTVSFVDSFICYILRLISSLLNRLSLFFLGKSSDYSTILKYYYRNYDYIKCFRQYKKNNNCDTIIAFLNEPIFLSILSNRKKEKLILSERNDPVNHEKTQTTMAFIRRTFRLSDSMVFQSPDAESWYVENASIKNGKVIFNPIKSDLPERFTGERRKTVVNFCRISSQKNLHLLVKAFAKFNEDFPEYELCIYGDAVGNGVDGYIESVRALVDTLECKDKIHILPAQKDIHNIIKDCAMFVSSSDFEGMSNSMLEAMGMGLPTICTDCPAGGARAIIKDHENGILVPIKDVESMYRAMKEVAENKELAEKLSINGTKLREELSLDRITDKWTELLDV